MKQGLFIMALLLTGQVYCQSNKQQNSQDTLWLHREIPQLPYIITDSLSTSIQDADKSFNDRMPTVVPDLSDIEKMPLMPIDTSTNFIILKKRLYNYEDEQLPPATEP